MTDKGRELTVADLAAIDDEKTPQRMAFDAMVTAAEGEPPGTLGEVLWQAIDEEAFDVVRLRKSWARLAEATDCYDASRFLELLQIAADYDERVARSGIWAWETYSDLPGWPVCADRFFEVNEGDDAFFDELAARWKSVSDPYGRALGVKLAAAGFIDADELAENTREVLAVAYLGQIDHRWGDDLPWEDEAWKKALLRAALSDEIDKIREPSVLCDVRPIANAEEMVAVAQKSASVPWSSQKDDSFGFFDAIASYGAEIVDPLREALLDLDDFERKSAAEPYAAFYLVVGYLRACEVADEEPAAEVDGQIRRFVASYVAERYGHNFSEPEVIRRALSGLSEDRLCDLFLSVDHVSWHLIAAAPVADSDELQEHVVEHFSDEVGPRGAWRDAGLKAMERAAVPLLVRVHKRYGYQDEFVLEKLEEFGAEDDRAIPALASLLISENSKTRRRVKKLLRSMSPDAVVEQLGEALASSDEKIRLSAAEVLYELPPSESSYRWARQLLEKEDNSAVRDVLDRVEAPQEKFRRSSLDSAVHREFVSALKETSGAAWQAFDSFDESADDDEVVLVYWDFLTEKYRRQKMAKTSGPVWEHLAQMLEHYSDSPVARGVATDLLGFVDRLSYPRFPNRLARAMPGFASDVAEALVEGRIERHRHFGPATTSSRSTHAQPSVPFDALKWLVEYQPEHAWKAVVDGLYDESRKVRDYCAEFIAEDPQRLATNEVILLLAAEKEGTRQSAVKLLDAIADPEYIPLLKEALATEESRLVRSQIEQTLAHLVIKNLDVADYDDDADGHGELDAVLADSPVLSLPFRLRKAIDELPGLHWRSGLAMSEEAKRWFIAAICAESKDYRGEAVRQVRARLEDSDCHALCEALIDVAGKQHQGWALYIQSIVASPERIEGLGEELEKIRPSQKLSWRDDAVEVLVRTEAPQAVFILYDAERRIAHFQLRKLVQRGLERIADARQMDVEELVDLSMADLDGGEGELRGSEVERVRRIQTRRLEEAMVAGRRWKPAMWREQFAAHRLMSEIAGGLVWGRYDGDDGLRSAFLLDDRESVAFDENSDLVGVVHPMELGDAIADWRQRLGDADRAQPFAQLDRKLYMRGDFDDLEDVLQQPRIGRSITIRGDVKTTTYSDEPPEFWLRDFFDTIDKKTYVERARGLGYEEDQEQYSRYVKTVGEITIIYNEETEFIDPEKTRFIDDEEKGLTRIDAVGTKGEYIDALQIIFKRNGQELSFADLEPILYSEVFRDLHIVMEGS